MQMTAKIRRVVSAAVCAAITATVAAFPAANVAAQTINQKIAEEEKYLGYTADYATSGLESLTFYVTSSTAGSFSYGFGIGTADKPYWIEMDNGKLVTGEGSGTSVKLNANESTPITIDLSKFTLSYAPKSDQYPGKFEFRNYYSDGTITLDKIVANDSGDSPSPGGDNTSKNTKSGSYSFKDNKDGTATITSTLTGTIDDIDAVLTRGYDEETYYDPETGKSTWTESDPINSRKLTYEDFGLPVASENEKITLESFTFSIASDVNMDTFMFGCGLNVQYKSPADSEYWIEQQKDDPDKHKGYWYNEHGADEDGEYGFDPDELEIVPTEGTTLEDCGQWVDAVWDVPAEIQEYTTVKPSDSVSVQFWYGANKENGYEEYDEVTLKSATCTYTLEKTVPFTGKTAIDGMSYSLTQGNDKTNSASVSLSKLGLTENDKPVAFLFSLANPSEIKKLVFGVGVSDKSVESQYTDFQYAVLDAAKDQQIMWILPDGIDVDSAYGSVTFGYYYGADKSDELVDTIKLVDIMVYYVTEGPETTTTTTETTNPQNQNIRWGDTDCNDEVNVMDAVLLARVAAEDTKCGVTEQGKLNADVEYDGKIKTDDLTKLLKYLAGLIDYSKLGNQ